MTCLIELLVQQCKAQNHFDLNLTCKKLSTFEERLDVDFTFQQDKSGDCLNDSLQQNFAVLSKGNAFQF